MRRLLCMCTWVGALTILVGTYVDESMASPLPATHIVLLCSCGCFMIYTYVGTYVRTYYIHLLLAVISWRLPRCGTVLPSTVMMGRQQPFWWANTVYNLQALACFASTDWFCPHCARTYIRMCTHMVCRAEHAVVAGPVTVPTFGQHWSLSRLPLSVMASPPNLLHCDSVSLFFVYQSRCHRSLYTMLQCMHAAKGGVRPDWMQCIYQFLTGSAVKSLTYVHLSRVSAVSYQCQLANYQSFLLNFVHNTYVCTYVVCCAVNSHLM